MPFLLLCQVHGTQVAWREVDHYIHFITEREGSDLKKEMRVRVHYIDSVMNLLSLRDIGEDQLSIEQAEKLYVAWNSELAS